MTEERTTRDAYIEAAKAAGINPVVAEALHDNVGVVPRRRTLEVPVPMALKPNQDEVGSLAIGVLTRGRRDCECGRNHPDGIDTEVVWRLMHMTRPLNTSIVTIMASGYRIPDARNSLVRAALNAGCQYLFMTDDDMLLHRNTLLRLYQLAKQHQDAGLIGAWSVSKAKNEREPFVYIDGGLGGGAWWGIVKAHNEINKQLLENQKLAEQGKPTAPGTYLNQEDVPPVEISGIGTGTVILNLKWAKKLCDPPAEPCDKHKIGHCHECHTEQKPWFIEGLETEGGATRTWGQDIYYCHRLREIGAKVLVDPTLFIPHLERNTGIAFGPPKINEPVPAKELEKQLNIASGNGKSSLSKLALDKPKAPRRKKAGKKHGVHSGRRKSGGTSKAR